MTDHPQCVILAGGLGTRMRPLTDSFPKAMLPVAGHPFAARQLEFLIESGIQDFVYLIGYRGELLREYLQDGRKWGVRIRYVDEGSQLRGTAGALRLAFDAGVLNTAFLLIYGDSFTPISIQDVWRAFKSSAMPALMTVLRNDGRWDRSNVLYEDNRIVLYEKNGLDRRCSRMRHIDYGVSALNRDIVKHSISQAFPLDLARIFAQLSREGRLGAFEADERFYEIGSPAGLADFESYILAARKSADLVSTGDRR